VQSVLHFSLPPDPLLQEVKINDTDNVTLSMFVFWVVMKYDLDITTQKISINILLILRTSELKTKEKTLLQVYYRH
jgi:hypothetical protein